MKMPTIKPVKEPDNDTVRARITEHITSILEASGYHVYTKPTVMIGGRTADVHVVLNCSRTVGDPQ